ncbi:hypothetical protein GH714_004498 [Hevea brasiliensis]|uniref:Cytochrome P450 n=1 Tax=Hevea brasiliensis TaxID=3981 RepID=A0A6A6LFQ8_HEVBR|nr:hypothetical protein GH714_004498 [Hevea brasiliensis]
MNQICQTKLSSKHHLRELEIVSSCSAPSAHLSSDDCTIQGFHVPSDTVLFANIWAIQRDPNLWEDPTSFKPERFENGKAEAFKFLPFGLGRRACPGEGLANRIMGLTLGSLIQCFEWERVDGKEIDMAEKTTITMSKVKPLEVMCKSCSILHKVKTILSRFA